MVLNVNPETCAKDSEVERVFARRAARVEAMISKIRGLNNYLYYFWGSLLLYL